MSIHTILFDLDGTLIDTNELIIESFMHTFAWYGQTLSRAEAIEFIGPPLQDTFRQFDPDQADALIAVYRQHNQRNHDAYVKAFPYAAETLDELKQRGFRLGIVTSKMRESVDMGLQTAGLDGYFETIITLDDVSQAKPHPEPVETAIKALDATSESALMVGDNSHDIESGQRAGIRTAAVAWSLKGRETLLSHRPSYMLEDMRDLLRITGV